MNAHLRAELFNLGAAVKSYYLVHGGAINNAPLEVQNLCASIDYCLSDAPESDQVGDAAACGLLKVGISIIETDAAAASITVGAALYRAREVLQQRKAHMTLVEALRQSHTAECWIDGVCFQVQEGVNFCVRRLAVGDDPDAFAAMHLETALAIAAGRGWPLDAEAGIWTPVLRKPSRTPMPVEAGR